MDGKLTHVLQLGNFSAVRGAYQNDWTHQIDPADHRYLPRDAVQSLSMQLAIVVLAPVLCAVFDRRTFTRSCFRFVYYGDSTGTISS